ncbi:type VI secretion system tube protein Hcp [Aggregatibacter actinomycetemcomitans]|uniref:type VI secretion system tube protein TssD n=1 Tax=Aggregatibacter actinomycetemcomitans TaxID=714 RepID=UPI00197C4BC7|nr:type VI secretion system tube protein TssD [Aggregatibacter actinomycetemcomitans]MBN6075128.1 type VI secretion system tube protein Hcp [Aggregatibacter actinomycetemcomitans]MBN6077071.1 type VI secretion system tube protein Hcp [Aggregatibacter actinomycetemcomitans]
MANIIYMKITGKKLGLISALSSSSESIGSKMQQNHIDEILVYSIDHELTYHDNVMHHPISITKPLDRSSPLLAQAIAEGDIMECEINFYRTAIQGGYEHYYSISLNNAKLMSISSHFPNSLTHNDQQPYEQLTMIYECIGWKHIAASSFAYSFWENRPV